MSPDPWRWRCPEGHCSWVIYANQGYYCQSCDEVYDRIIDQKTGEVRCS